MIIESYIIGFICCLINLRVLDFYSDDKWTFANSVLTCLLLPVLILFPILAPCFMRKNFATLNSKDVLVKYGEMYTSYNIKNESMPTYWVFDYCRKILLGICIVLFSTQFQLHMSILFSSSIAMLIVNGYIKKARFS